MCHCWPVNHCSPIATCSQQWRLFVRKRQAIVLQRWKTSANLAVNIKPLWRQNPFAGRGRRPILPYWRTAHIGSNRAGHIFQVAARGLAAWLGPCGPVSTRRAVPHQIVWTWARMPCRKINLDVLADRLTALNFRQGTRGEQEKNDEQQQDWSLNFHAGTPCHAFQTWRR